MTWPPRVGRALHYYAAGMPIPPTWARTGHVVEQIGAHVFLEGVA